MLKIFPLQNTFAKQQIRIKVRLGKKVKHTNEICQCDNKANLAIHKSSNKITIFCSLKIDLCQNQNLQS